MKKFLIAGLTALSCSIQAATITFDFGDGTQLTPSPVNSVTPTSAGVQNTVASALDSTGSATGISLATSGFNGTNLNGATAPTGALAIFDPQTTRDSLFGNTATFGPGIFPFATLTFAGLDASGGTAYSFEFGASRTGVTDNRQTRYTITGLNSAFTDLNASGNTSNTAFATGLIPNATGNIVIDVRPGPANNNTTGFYYLGGLKLVSSPIPEPAGTALLVGSALAMASRRRR